MARYKFEIDMKGIRFRPIYRQTKQAGIDCMTKKIREEQSLFGGHFNKPCQLRVFEQMTNGNYREIEVLAFAPIVEGEEYANPVPVKVCSTPEKSLQKEPSIKVTIEGQEGILSKREYIETKHRGLVQFGYDNLAQAEVEKQLEAVLEGKEWGAGLNIIGMFIQKDKPERVEE